MHTSPSSSCLSPLYSANKKVACRVASIIYFFLLYRRRTQAVRIQYSGCLYWDLAGEKKMRGGVRRKKEGGEIWRRVLWLLVARCWNPGRSCSVFLKLFTAPMPMQAPPFTATLHWAPPQNTRSHMHKYKWNPICLKQAKEQRSCFVLVTEQCLLQGEREWATQYNTNT